MSSNITLSTCSLSQWALDFTGNLSRIKTSIKEAKELGSSYRVGPELETCGYGCEDHFLEPDTIAHSWELIADLLSSDLSVDFLIDIGAPVYRRSVLYNCRVFLLNRQIVLIRPKTALVDDGNYRESRWFRAWPPEAALQDFELPAAVRASTALNQRRCPFGMNAALFDDHGVSLSSEICEELWSPAASHVDLFLQGVDILSNGSASHHVLRKLQSRIARVQSATRSAGGVYLYANQRGCDGGRLYYDGAPMVAINGELLSRGKQFALDSEVETLTVTININDVRAYRAGHASRGVQASTRTAMDPLVRIQLPDGFRFASRLRAPRVSLPITNHGLHSVEEEIAYGPACWLWDYLRRSRMRGFFLPLSGGADSCATALIVGCMCQMLVRAAHMPDCKAHLMQEIRHAAGESETYVPTDARELANKLLCTMYMGAAQASSAETRERARRVAGEVGAWHRNVEIDGVVAAMMAVVRTVFGEGCVPRFRANGGSVPESVALQNVQARIRMVLSYLFAQLINWARGRDGSLLVLGSANVDESLRGYLTKYDCSAADINPIGGVSKEDLRKFLHWAARSDGLGYPAAADIVRALPSAELEPAINGRAQSDEVDMGMTYAELSVYGRLRKIGRCGPVAMFTKALEMWSHLSASEVAKKVKHFWRTYAINRHKLTTLTPALHAEDYAPDDNRFDLRQFLYNVRWTWQFRRIDDMVRSHHE